MTDMVQPEKTIIETPAEGVEVQDMDARLAQAEGVQAGIEAGKPSVGDQEQLQHEIANIKYPAAIEADNNLSKSTSVGDQSAAQENVEKAAFKGQMTDTPHYNQGNHPDCLLQSARMAETKQTGVDPGLEVYKNEAMRQHNYLEAGGAGGVSDMEKFAKQMDARPGIEANYQNGARLSDIKASLDQGESVIVGVDAAEFYPELGLPPESGGHAVVVTGLSEKSDGTWNVTVNDSNETGPNTPKDGTTFTKAWQAAGNPMISIHKSGG